MRATGSLWSDAYLAWVNSWLSVPWNASENTEDAMSVEEMVKFFGEKYFIHLLNTDNLRRIITSFRRRADANELLLGGQVPPSCIETNILKQRYDPRTNCSCNGLYPVPSGISVESVQQMSGCLAIKKMTELESLVNSKENEWNPGDIFTAEHLHTAVAELVLLNGDEQPPPDTCLGPMPSLATVQAPDRRPDPNCDTQPSVYHQLYPSNEQIKLLSDARYFFAIASAGGLCDDGLARAAAEAGNDILIADYCEAADEKSLAMLQDVKAAAVAFLKMCNLAGVVTDWQFNNHVALAIQFSVLGYYRDHSRSCRPGGVYGSHMTDILAHRYIDLAIYVGVMTASMGTGQQISTEQYHLLAEACCYINDIIDVRSDAMRKSRESVILRGIRGNLCKYLDNIISSCLQRAAMAIRSSPVSALVVMGCCNWMLMSSQHKAYELFHGVKERKDGKTCDYVSASDGSYQQLLEVLDEYGSLGENGPSVAKRRADMDLLYHTYRSHPQTHTAWLADSTRSLLNPVSLRRIIDVVHFDWHGDTGDVEYCP
ncbi:hypothetical protein AnigIFM63326_010051 [Aspergillus niger]|nr:hypothetical protein AnigIFM63326_010051 [Aspergillus niger]